MGQSPDVVLRIGAEMEGRSHQLVANLLVLASEIVAVKNPNKFTISKKIPFDSKRKMKSSEADSTLCPSVQIVEAFLIESGWNEWVRTFRGSPPCQFHRIGAILRMRCPLALAKWL